MIDLVNKAQSTKRQRRTRLLLADDHQMLVDALKGILEPHFEVVGTVNNGRALVEAARTLQPEVVILDIAMPELNGLDAARYLKRSAPNTKIVFLTMHMDPDLVAESFRAGGSAFVLKQAAARELTEAIEAVLKGVSYLSPSAAKGQANISLRELKDHQPTAEPTPRQREVIQLLAEGRQMKEAASILNITQRTIAAHKYAVMERLQLKTNADLVQYAIKQKIISL
jgi:DNA-binding NarL/FixJ family response regulator